jgi:hypothetical protein
MDPNTNDLKDFANNPKPFSLLEIDPQGKTLIELYRELHDRAEEEFKEHCYRSMKNYTFQKFRVSEFYKRYQFLRNHLDELCIWLFVREEYLPAALLDTKQNLPEYNNPWGVKEYTSRPYLNFKKKKHQLLANEIKSYLSDFLKLPLNFIKEDANLFTLSLLSEFFQEGNAHELGIKLDDINPEKLFIAVKDLPVKMHMNKREIFIDQLLYKTAGKFNIYVKDEIGRDGLANYTLNLYLCIMEVPPRIKKYLKDEDRLDTANTVEEFFRAFIVPQKP